MLVGTKLGAYEVLAKLGEGGMGEVYRARDSRLNRDVAIKVLPDAFADDAERVARFEREAQLLAAVNHAHIAAIYGLEGRAIVLELVEGATLAERVDAGRLPVDDAVPIAIQIAEALEAAHEKGVIHRDLKPANIKLTPDGDVKVLDFGLAKLLDTQTPDARIAESPTFTAPATFAGVILGTAPYMSPEQARGRAVDKRTDIWAFGCVLFEMLSGTRAFPGDDVTETLGAIIHKEPPWDALPADVPAHLRGLLRRCLQKSPKERLRDIGDARIELTQPAIAAVPAHAPPSPHMARAGWIAAAVLAGVIGVLAFTTSGGDQPSSSPAPVARFQISPAGLSGGLPPVVSPDGHHLAYVTREGLGRAALWVRSIDAIEPRRLTGGSNVEGMIFWSPDSRSIVYSAAAILRRMDIDGGSTTIGPVPGGAGAYRGGAWSREGVILIGSTSGIYQMKNGTAVPVSRLADGDAMHATPSFLPDGRRFVFLRAGRTGEDGFYAGSLDNAPDAQLSRRLAVAASGGQFVYLGGDAGYFFYTQDSRLLVQPVDTTSLDPVGEPAVISDSVAPTTTQNPRRFSAGGGTVVFRDAAPSADRELRWFDPGGKALDRLGDLGAFLGLDVSRDGRFAVVERNHPETGVSQLWSIDLGRGVFTRINPGEASDVAPALADDGRVAFTLVSPGSTNLGDLYRRAINGSGEPELLYQSPTMKHPNDWSPDGRFLIFDDHHPTQRQDLWLLPMDGARQPQPLLVTPADETLAHFSPDGQWIVYRSDESGRSEIYLRDFAPERSPAVGDQKWTLSRDGGDKPRWSADGKAVFYIAPNRMITRVPLVFNGRTVQLGAPVPLFEVNPMGWRPYDVTPDHRFLVTSVADQEGQAEPINIVLNWQRLLSRQ